VDEIVAMAVGSTYLYVALDDETNIGCLYAKATPLTSSSEIPIPSGITESPVAICATSSDLWFLTPGSVSGDKAKVIKMTLSGGFVETIHLNVTGKVIIDAISITEDEASGDLYIGTNTSPANLVRIYETTGGSYDYDVTPLA